jgi:hypothetical protein
MQEGTLGSPPTPRSSPKGEVLAGMRLSAPRQEAQEERLLQEWGTRNTAEGLERTEGMHKECLAEEAGVLPATEGAETTEWQKRAERLQTGAGKVVMAGRTGSMGFRATLPVEEGVGPVPISLPPLEELAPTEG